MCDTFPQIRIVITSSLRTEKDKWYLNDFKLVGLLNKIIGHTTKFKVIKCHPERFISKGDMNNSIIKKYRETTHDFKSIRGQEVQDWLLCNKGLLGSKLSELQYYILDDNEQLGWLIQQADKLIICDKYKGFEERVFELLKSKIESYEE